MPVGNLHQRGQRCRTLHHARGAARLEGASGGQSGQRGHGAFYRLERTGAIRLQIGHGMEQATGIRVGRGPKDVVLGTKFYEASRIHNGDAVCDVRDDSQVVRDEQHGEAKLGTKFGEQFKNLGLDGDIEGGRRLVCNQQLRTVHDGHSDHNALSHPAGKLVGIIAGTGRRFRDGDIVHGIDGALPSFTPRNYMVGKNSFGDLVSHAHDGVECGHGLLEDHGHERAAELAHGGVVEGSEIACVRIVGEYDFPVDLGLWREKAHDGQRGHRFSRTRFPHEAEDFAASDGEAQVTNGGEKRCTDSRLSGRLQDGGASFAREPDVEVTNF